jgi:teichuronic acid biosynthesis glycosyltransferase TuaG
MTSHEPLVSIITPAYNVEAFLSETINSVLEQTHKNWEMIVVDDCSRDGTANVAQRFASQDSRVIFVQHDKNSGPAEARNTAVKRARGRFIAFLDSDDQWLPKKLERQLKFMAERGLSFTFTPYRRISTETDSPGKLIAVPNQISYRDLLKHTAIATSTVILDREKTGPFSLVKGMGYDDFILWLDILKRGHTAVAFHEDLMRYRLVPQSVSHDKIRSAKWVWNIYRKHEKLSLLDACWCLMNYGLRGYFKHRTF